MSKYSMVYMGFGIWGRWLQARSTLPQQEIQSRHKLQDRLVSSHLTKHGTCSTNNQPVITQPRVYTNQRTANDWSFRYPAERITKKPPRSHQPIASFHHLTTFPHLTNKHSYITPPSSYSSTWSNLNDLIVKITNLTGTVFSVSRAGGIRLEGEADASDWWLHVRF